MARIASQSWELFGAALVHHWSTFSASLMAPYEFDAPDVDAVLRSSDGKEFRVHRLILGLASPVFQDMFSLPQPIEPPSHIPTIDVLESSDVLEPFIQYLYPCAPPKVLDLSMWTALYIVADKYNAEVVMDPLRDMLIPRFLTTSPLRVYALASHWSLEEEAKIAARATLTMDISEGFPEEDARLMGSVACQKLYLLHIQRRDQARILVNKRPYQFSDRSCACSPTNFPAMIQALSQRLATRPWLTAEGLYEEAAKSSNSIFCLNCRNSFKNMHTWFSSILKDVSELPQTI